MSRLCPLCNEEVGNDFKHFYEHFNYRRFSCSDCNSKFYTVEERNQHVLDYGHKLSFMKNINPYLDMIVGLISKDAEFLNSIDLDDVVAARVKYNLKGDESLSSSSSTEDKRSKRRMESVPPTKKRRRSNQENNVDSFSTPNEAVAPPEDEMLVNSTRESRTMNNRGENLKYPETPRNRKSKNNSENSENNSRLSGVSATLLSELMGYSSKESQKEPMKVPCNICNQNIVYDYIIRKDHVGRNHIEADVDPNDYEAVLKMKMDESFPDMPNTDLACQLCFTSIDIRSSSRREHIETKHFLKLPELRCPVDNCNLAYTRQCELSIHMKVVHKQDLGRFKDSEFQTNRKRRNGMISELTNKCFPMSVYDSLIRKMNGDVETGRKRIEMVLSEAREKSRSAISSSFRNDVRFKDAGKTRRAPVYNANTSESSSDEEESGIRSHGNTEKQKKSTNGRADEVSNTSGDIERISDTEDLCEDDVIFVRELFDSQVSKILGFGNIKVEPVSTFSDEVNEDNKEVLALSENPPLIHLPTLLPEPGVNTRYVWNDDVRCKIENPGMEIERYRSVSEAPVQVKERSGRTSNPKIEYRKDKSRTWERTEPPRRSDHFHNKGSSKSRPNVHNGKERKTNQKRSESSRRTLPTPKQKDKGSRKRSRSRNRKESRSYRDDVHSRNVKKFVQHQQRKLFPNMRV